MSAPATSVPTSTDPVVALDSERVSQLTGIPQSTLTNWERQGIYSPSYVDPVPHTPFRRIYSFRDVVSLRTLSKLRRDLGVSLAEIRHAGQYLAEQYDSPWSELRFGVIDKRLVFRDPETQEWVGGAGQGVLSLNLEGVPQEIAENLPAVLERDENAVGRITTNRYVKNNRPVIAGTRIPTATIWSFHEHGYSPEQILEEYPHLMLEDIHAALDFERSQRDAA